MTVKFKKKFKDPYALNAWFKKKMMVRTCVKFYVKYYKTHSSDFKDVFYHLEGYYIPIVKGSIHEG